jgi:ATP-dependent exoDNAse (exonuclease V) beta subunit
VFGESEIVFVHNFLKTIERLPERMEEGKRFYQLPNGEWVKSVTTIIGENTDKTKLEKWKERVGEEEAKRISNQATIRGTKIHKICEDYILNKDDYLENVLPDSIETFSKIKPYLNDNITKVIGVELALYSEILKTAGRTDLICEWNDIPTIVDFKTSTKVKKEEWIQNYFIQATCYANMFRERTGIDIPQFVILIANDEERYAQCFIKKTIDYQKAMEAIFIS